MAQGDLTKVNEYDKIEIVNQWNVQARKVIKVMEEQADGSKKEISRSHERFLYLPFVSKVSNDGKTWTHTATDMSSVDAKVKAIAESAWTDDVKTAYKTFTESQSI
tara:strand:- start:7224 stop:7541 length:318 start_codon:yes stop_codon:yes gene_type:complete